jgi:dTDP-4-amino-4,6-dideoxygalactose transaminase
MLLVGEPSLGEREKAALAEVIDSNWVTMGERVRAFERAFAAEQGTNGTAAVSSCTAGLHLVMAALGIGPDDEVLVPSLSFAATANCVLYTGATPVFVDIESRYRPLISVQDASLKCTPRTRAVIVMHYGGHVCDRESWRRFAASRGLFLIEDAAHAAGAAGAGTLGDAAVFSFYGNKNMTTAEGGMVVARDPELLDRVRQMRNHGMTSATHERLEARTPGYDVTMLGWNYRMDELRAAIGLMQLKSLRTWNQRRAELVGIYRDALAECCPGVMVPFANYAAASAHHLLPAVLPLGTDRKAVMAHMRTAGVQTTIHYPPIHTMSFYRNMLPPVSLPETEDFGRRELTMPLHPRLEERDVLWAAAALAAALAHSWQAGEAAQ